MSPENPKVEIPKVSAAEVKAPTVEAEAGTRVVSLAAHAEEQARREALVKKGVAIAEGPGIIRQEPDEARREREEAEAKDSARREKFFADLVAKFPELTEVQREAVRATMEREKSRTWSAYDGDEVKILRIAVEGNLLTIFVNVEYMYCAVGEMVSF